MRKKPLDRPNRIPVDRQQSTIGKDAAIKINQLVEVRLNRRSLLVIAKIQLAPIEMQIPHCFPFKFSVALRTFTAPQRIRASILTLSPLSLPTTSTKPGYMEAKTSASRESSPD